MRGQASPKTIRVADPRNLHKGRRICQLDYVRMVSRHPQRLSFAALQLGRADEPEQGTAATELTELVARTHYRIPGSEWDDAKRLRTLNLKPKPSDPPKQTQVPVTQIRTV